MRVSGDAFHGRLGTGLVKSWLRGVGLHEQPRLAIGRVFQHDVGLQDFVLLSNLGVERLRNLLTFEQGFGGEIERLAQDEANPGVVRGRIAHLGVPLAVGEAQQPMVVGVVGLKAVPERLQQHGHTEERAGHFDQ